MLREILADLIPPVFVVPGNHDRREPLLNTFAHENYMPPADVPFVNYVIDRFPLRLIGLDTTMPGHDYGMICDERLRWLDDALNARPDSPTMFLFITPHFAPACKGWMRRGSTGAGRWSSSCGGTGKLSA